MGYAFVWIGFVGAALSALLYWRNQVKLARLTFIVSVIAAFGAEAVLQYLLHTGRYDILYVFSFSDRSLSLWFKTAGAWAGQEGSFLLWLLWICVYGLILIRTTGGYERHVMGVYSLIMLFLFGILAYQSPFDPIPSDKIPPGMRITDGQGLNPSLENIWMTIHPPIIFAGFGGLAVPFAWGVASLIRGEYSEWAARCRPWAIYVTTVLGFGLTLGGFWAYETLGWGGFWAWDPVENCSYFPWLGMAALLHGLMLQVSRGVMARWNPFLAALPFSMFVYGTYLTRSGALADVSVHSFDGMGKSALWILIVMMGLGVAAPLGLWLWRFRSISNPKPLDATSGPSRQSMVTAGLALLLISAWVTLIATSYPLITVWLGREKQTLPIEFYHDFHAPWMIVTAILMAAAPAAIWRGMTADDLLKRLLAPWWVTIAFTLVAILLGVRNVWILMVAAMLVFAFASNAKSLFQRGKRTLGSVGGFLTHAGLTTTVLGLLISNGYEKKEEVILNETASAKAHGYDWRFMGMTSDPDEDKSNRVRIQVKNDRESFIAEPKYYNDWKSGEPRPVLWPWIKRGLTHDLYVSFLSRPEPQPEAALDATITTDKSVEAGPYKMKLRKFTSEGQMGQPGFRVGAQIEIESEGWDRPALVEPSVVTTEEGQQRFPSVFPDGAVGVIVSLSVDQKQVVLRMINIPDRPETHLQQFIPLQVFYKPLTILVWIGPGLTVLGGLLAMRRRSKDLKHLLKKLSAPSEPAKADAERVESAV
ncbi:MAG: cytochrome c biogenesis protein CcsA [Armatimonadetes bacterium]|nr:cytochrome c biogenesis protein CcsA [Armatimonadota bacterium]